MPTLKSIFTILMSPVLLWASLGFSVNRHYCLGLLKNESFYHPAASCSMHQNADETACDNAAEGSCSRSLELPSEPSNPEDYQWLLELDCCEDEWISVAPVEIESAAQKALALPQLVSLSYPLLSLPEIDFGLISDLFPSQFESRGPPRGLSFFLALWQRYLI